MKKRASYRFVKLPSGFISKLEGLTPYSQAAFRIAPNQAYLLLVSILEPRDVWRCADVLNPRSCIEPCRSLSWLISRAKTSALHPRMNCEACSGLTAAEEPNCVHANSLTTTSSPN